MKKDAIKIQNSLIGMLTLGILYQYKFTNRSDWLSISKIFSTKKLSFEFSKYATLTDSSLEVLIPDNMSDRIYDFMGAYKTSRLQRHIKTNSIIFDLNSIKEEFDSSNFYLYSYEVDYGPYRNLPPCIGRILHPFTDYFEINTNAIEVSPNLIRLKKPIISNAINSMQIIDIAFVFEKHYELSSIEISWNVDFKTTISFASESMVFQWNYEAKSQVYSVRFDDLDHSILRIGEIIKEAQYD